MSEHVLGSHLFSNEQQQQQHRVASPQGGNGDWFQAPPGGGLGGGGGYNNDNNNNNSGGGYGSQPIGGGGGGGNQMNSSAPQPMSSSGLWNSTPNPNAMGNSSVGSTSPNNDEDFDNEPPLLEELGVNIPHILSKTKAVLNPLAKSNDDGIMEDTDLAGPLCFCLLLGLALLLTGKVHFGYIYG
jgi:hypothetical protein